MLPTVALTAPTPAQTPSQSVEDSPRRPSVGRSSTWSTFGDYVIEGRASTASASSTGSALGAVIEHAERARRLIYDSPSVSPKTSQANLRVPETPGALPPLPRPLTPLTQLEYDFNVPASKGLAQRLKALASQTDSTVLEVLRRLSEAERESALTKSEASKKELRDFFATFMDFGEADVEACFNLALPLATWEHVAEQLLMEESIPRHKLATALYWRAKHRADRLHAYRMTGSASPVML